MEYDYGRSGGQGSGVFGPLYHGRAGSNNAQANNDGTYYPRVAQSAEASSMGQAPPQAPLVSSSSFPSGTAIKVAMKSLYRVGPPAQLWMQTGGAPQPL